LAAELCPDPLREFTALLRHPGWILKGEAGREEEG